MRYKFTLREPILLLTVVAFAAAFIASAIRSNQHYSGAYITKDSIVEAVQSIAPRAKRVSNCGRDGRTIVRLCFEYDIPTENADDFLSDLKAQLITNLTNGNCERIDLGGSLFRDGVQELRFLTDGYFVDVALYLLDDSLPPEHAMRTLGSGYRRLQFVVTRHAVKR